MGTMDANSNGTEGFVYKEVAHWDTDDVIRWMNGLHCCLEPHISQFEAHCIRGSDLLKLSHQQLEYLKVTEVGHQELLLEAVELLSALEKARTHDFTFTLASNLSKKTSQLINTLTTSGRKRHISSEDQEAAAILTRIETTSAVMMAAKLLLSWLDRNPSSLLQNYDEFRTDVLQRALDLAGILIDNFDASQMMETCRGILKCTAVMMHPEALQSVEPVNLLTVQLQPSESGLGFSIERTRRGNLVVNDVILGSPASMSGMINLGVEIVQINDQNVVGWEIGKVVETLKASGYEVSLVINSGSSSKESTAPPEDLPNGDQETSQGDHVTSGGDGTLESPCTDPGLLTNQSSDSFLTNTSHSTNYSDGMSSSQDTLDDVAESPASFEGDTDFSGMEKVLVKTRALDLHRTSSAPLTHREKAVVLGDTSVDSGPSSAEGHCEIQDDRNTASMDCLDDCLDGASGEGDDGVSGSNPSFESRLQMRTSSDGTVEKGKKKEKKKPGHLPPVAYRTQVIGGVVVRVPIKPEDQEKSQKRQRNSRHRHKKAGTGGKPLAGAGGGGRGKEDSGEGGGSSIEITTPTGAEEQFPLEGDEGSGDKSRAVFSQCKEVTVGGQTTKQVTVSSNTEIVGGTKKTSNPALMVPCFQLKEAQKEGFMCKLGGTGLTPKNWRRRWFVLKDKRLYYYKTAFDVSALGIVDMVGYSVEQSFESKKKYVLKATRQGARTYYFQTESSEEMLSWMECLKDASVPDDHHTLMGSPQTIEASDDEL